MAYVSRKNVTDVIQDKGNPNDKRMNFHFLRNISGTELVFIVYPHTIALMEWSTLWALLFFFMVITLGIDSTVSSSSPYFDWHRKFDLSSVVSNQLLPVYVTNSPMSLVGIVRYLFLAFSLYAIWAHYPHAPMEEIILSLWWVKYAFPLLYCW